MPGQAYKRLPDQTVSPQTIVGVLNAIHAAGTSLTYYDGTGRTQGSGSAHTVDRYQNAGTTEFVHGIPPATTLGLKWGVGGQAAATKTPTMLSPDTFVAGWLVGSCVKNAGAFNAWDAAAPFTSGQSPGYARLADATAVAGKIPNKVYCFESPESFFVYLETTSGTFMCAELGPWLNPKSSHALAAESDGLRYGMRCTGGTVIPAGFATAGDGSDAWLGHSGTNGAAHSWVLDVGASTVISAYPMFRPSVSTTSSLKNPGGELVKVRPLWRRNAAAPNDTWLGEDRSLLYYRRGKALQDHRDSGNVLLGWLLTYSASVDGDAVLLATTAV